MFQLFEMTGFVHSDYGFLLVVKRRIRHAPSLDFAKGIDLMLEPGLMQFRHLMFRQWSIALRGERQCGCRVGGNLVCRELSLHDHSS